MHTYICVGRHSSVSSIGDDGRRRHDSVISWTMQALIRPLHSIKNKPSFFNIKLKAFIWIFDTPKRFLGTAEPTSSDVTKNLKVRSIIFDVDTLIGDSSPPKACKAPLKIETKKKGEPKKTVDGLTSVKAKYMQALRDRLGSGTSSALQEDRLPVSKGDAQILMSGKSMVNARVSDNLSPDGTSASAWLLRPGMGSVVDYIRFRSISLGLLLGKASIRTREMLMGQMKETRFVVPVQINSEETDQEKCEAQEEAIYNDVTRLLEQLNAVEEPSSVMLVSRNDSLLEIASNLGLYTCRFRDELDRYGSVHTHYSARSPLEVQDALEHINGVAMRGSALSSRSY